MRAGARRRQQPGRREAGAPLRRQLFLSRRGGLALAHAPLPLPERVPVPLLLAALAHRRPARARAAAPRAGPDRAAEPRPGAATERPWTRRAGPGGGPAAHGPGPGGGVAGGGRRGPPGPAAARGGWRAGKAACSDPASAGRTARGGQPLPRRWPRAKACPRGGGAFGVRLPKLISLHRHGPALARAAGGVRGGGRRGGRNRRARGRVAKQAGAGRGDASHPMDIFTVLPPVARVLFATPPTARSCARAYAPPHAGRPRSAAQRAPPHHARRSTPSPGGHTRPPHARCAPLTGRERARDAGATDWREAPSHWRV